MRRARRSLGRARRSLLLTASGGCTSAAAAPATRATSAATARSDQIAVADRGDAVGPRAARPRRQPLSLAVDARQGRRWSTSGARGARRAARRRRTLVAAAKELATDGCTSSASTAATPAPPRPRPSSQQYGITWPSFYSPGGEALLALPRRDHAQRRPVDHRPRRRGPGRRARSTARCPSDAHPGPRWCRQVARPGG